MPKDLQYKPIQPDLFLFLLPACLFAWSEDLTAVSDGGYGGFVECFLPALTRHPGALDLLNPVQRKAVSRYMQDGILKCIDHNQILFSSGAHAWAYRWFLNLGSFAVIFPDVNEIWTRWWAMETIGSAIGVLQYLSCLMYDDGTNPVFAPWTPTGGGGPPPLWEKKGHIYDTVWLPENVAFLRDVLSVDYALDRLRKAASVLLNGENRRLSQQMLSDVGVQRRLLEVRIAELPQLLQKLELAGQLLRWTT